MSYTAFDLNISAGVATIVWDQPDRGNPFDGTFCKEFSEIAVECDVNPEVRAVLMKSRGKFFSVGGDVKTFTTDRSALPNFIKTASADLHNGVSRFARMDAPVIIACHSLVTGGAVSITAMADFAIASEDARFLAAFTRIGFSGDSGTTYNLPRRVGHRRAFEFLVRNQTWTAQKALEYGLVNQVVGSHEELEVAATDLAEELAAGPTLAFGEIKRLFISNFEQPLEAQLELESRALARASVTDDAWEGLTSVLDKTEPSFVGR